MLFFHLFDVRYEPVTGEDLFERSPRYLLAQLPHRLGIEAGHMGDAAYLVGVLLVLADQHRCVNELVIALEVEAGWRPAHHRDGAIAHFPPLREVQFERHRPIQLSVHKQEEVGTQDVPGSGVDEGPYQTGMERSSWESTKPTVATTARAGFKNLQDMTPPLAQISNKSEIWVHDVVHGSPIFSSWAKICNDR